MKIQVTDAPKSQKIISIELPYETFVAAEDAETELVAKDAKIQGFRPGKAPREIVKKQNLQKIRSGALEKLINNAVRDALVSNNINPLGQPDVRDVTMEDGKPISFTVHVDVFPQIDLNNTKGFDFEKVKVSITDADVESTIKNLQQQFTEFVEIEKARPVKDGDQVEIDYEGKIDGVPFSGGTAQHQTLLIGSGQFIPGFEEGVIGMNIGETKDVTLKFPEEYHAADLAGKETVFTVKLHGIKEKKVPAIDADFAKKINPKLESADMLNERILKDLQNEVDQYTKMDAFTVMLNKLVAENPFEVPQSIVYEQATRMAQQSLQQYQQMGINPEMFGMTAQSMMGQFLQGAEEQIKRALVINRVVELEGLTATDEDFKKAVERIVEMSGMSSEDVNRELLQNQQAFMGIQNDIMSDKVYEFLARVNNVKDKVMTREEYEKMKAEEGKKQAAGDNAEADEQAEEKPKKKAKAKADSEAADAEKEAKPRKPRAKKSAEPAE